jgi:lysophospholipase L1-like esterase
MRSKKQKAILIVSGFLIALALGEVLFRIGGFLLIQYDKEYDHEINNVYKILCLGDSTTYGLGASDIDKFSYPMQLQKILDTSNSMKKYIVINKGIPGLNSSQLLNRLRKFLSENKPDLVIIMIGINDPWNLEESNILKFYKGNILNKVLLNSEVLLNKIRLYQFFKLLFVSTKFGEPKTISVNSNNKAESFKYKSDNELKSQALYSALEYNISEMLRILNEFGVEGFFMKYHSTGWGSPEKAINQIYAQLNIPVVDNKTVFNSALLQGLGVFGKDGWHPNDLGHELIAKNIYNAMITEQVIQGEPYKLYEDFNETKIFVPKVFESKVKNFHDDFIWTKGKGTIFNIHYEIKPHDKLLVLHTFGWNPYKNDLSKLNLQVKTNEKNLKFNHQDDNSFYFILDKNIGKITKVQVISSTFIPKQLGINNDTRELGIDIVSIEIK